MKIPLLAALAAVCVLGVTTTARADVESERRTKEGDEYRFKDDLLNSDVSFPKGGSITIRPLAGRVMLIRPRASFVQEMLKSVEHI
jgi:hypothetical protein